MITKLRNWLIGVFRKKRINEYRVNRIKNWNSKLNESKFEINFYYNQLPNLDLISITSLQSLIEIYISVIKESCKDYHLLWSKNRNKSQVLIVRYIFEIWTVLHYIKDIFEKIKEIGIHNFNKFIGLFENDYIAKLLDEEVDKKEWSKKVLKEVEQNEVLNRFIYELRNDVQMIIVNYIRLTRRSQHFELPQSLFSKYKWISPKKLRQSLKKSYSNAENTYSFLSEASHPNIYRITKDIGEERVKINERILTELENCLEGIQKLIDEIYSLILEILSKFFITYALRIRSKTDNLNEST